MSAQRFSLPISTAFSSPDRPAGKRRRQTRSVPEVSCFRIMVLYIGIIIGLEGCFY